MDDKLCDCTVLLRACTDRTVSITRGVAERRESDDSACQSCGNLAFRWVELALARSLDLLAA